jgi:hypothetical protein
MNADNSGVNVKLMEKSIDLLTKKKYYFTAFFGQPLCVRADSY